MKPHHYFAETTLTHVAKSTLMNFRFFSRTNRVSVLLFLLIQIDKLQLKKARVTKPEKITKRKEKQFHTKWTNKIRVHFKILLSVICQLLQFLHKKVCIWTLQFILFSLVCFFVLIFSGFFPFFFVFFSFSFFFFSLFLVFVLDFSLHFFKRENVFSVIFLKSQIKT